MLTRAAPVLRAASSVSSSRMPPDSSTATSTSATTSAISSRLSPRPNAASRSTRWIHSAPSRCHCRAASRGAPYDVSDPASPFTRRTACPSDTSTAGRRTKGVMSTSYSTEGGQPVAEQVQPGGCGLLRVELRRREHSLLDRGDKPVTVFAGRLGVVSAWCDGVGVNEVEPLVTDTVEQCRPGRGLDGVPAHVREDVCLQPLHLAAEH